jgi:hypothetical protein
MYSSKPSSSGYSRRMRLEEAARELAGSGASREEIMDVLDSVGARRPEVTGAIALAGLDGRRA